MTLAQEQLTFLLSTAQELLGLPAQLKLITKRKHGYQGGTPTTSPHVRLQEKFALYTNTRLTTYRRLDSIHY